MNVPLQSQSPRPTEPTQSHPVTTDDLIDLISQAIGCETEDVAVSARAGGGLVIAAPVSLDGKVLRRNTERYVVSAKVTFDGDIEVMASAFHHHALKTMARDQAAPSGVCKVDNAITDWEVHEVAPRDQDCFLVSSLITCQIDVMVTFDPALHDSVQDATQDMFLGGCVVQVVGYTLVGQ
jgi:hypothetical protein